MSEQFIPFFVYGTLRPGEGNYSWALAGRTDVEITGYLHEATMYGNRGFPYVILTPGEGVVTGTLCYVHPEEYQATLKSLDGLEGYHGPNERNHYDRVLRTITLDDGTQVEAYVYVASGDYADQVKSTIPVIESGDWLEHIRTPLASVHDDTDKWWETYR